MPKHRTIRLSLWQDPDEPGFSEKDEAEGDTGK